MPLTDLREINDATFLGFWQITETTEELTLLFRKLRPQQEIPQFKSQQRQLEWLASRILAYLLLQDFTPEPFEISSNENGKPEFSGTTYEASISQSGGLVAVLLSDTFEVGIDIEIIREKILKIASKFLSDKELQQADQDLKKTCLYWSAKETLYKMYSRKKLLFKENLAVGPVPAVEKGVLQGEVLLHNFQRNFTVHFENFDNFMLTYCLASPENEN
ncbi:4'-phosphopantetheinyl transferase family protein [Adhaeribacter terreus]|uniref:4'-phosphopantetheinyl transferase family protein n=1 Tax=Adhaeribacter terreus TaxID=529703 RepID=A0ABW0E9I0_9BACT